MAAQKYLSFFRERIPNLATPNDKGESVNVCIFHTDKSPSLAVNVDTGLWKCYTPTCAGARGGNYKQFDKLLKGEVAGADVKVEPIDPAAIDGFHDLLKRTESALHILHHKRGLNNDTINKYKLGWDGDRILIPIIGPDGKSIVNVRKYAYGAQVDKMIAWGMRYNRARLFPVQALEQQLIILTEGEWDTLLLRQMGFNAMTSTGGADTWMPEFTEMLRGKDIVMCYDTDKSGRKGATQIAVKLFSVAKSIRMLTLPLAGTKEEKDVTDYVVTLKNDAAAFQKLLDLAPVFEAPAMKAKGEPDADVNDIHLSRIGDKNFVGKRVRSTVLVAGKDLAPFQVPYKTEFACAAVGSEKMCERCPLGAAGGAMTLQFKEHSPELLEFVHVSKEKVASILKRGVGIPECDKPTAAVTEYANIESVKFIPELDFEAEQAEYVIRNMFYLGERMETNHTYQIEGVVMPEPKTQYATCLVYKAEKAQTSIEKFELTPEVQLMLKMFTVEEQ